MPTPGKGDHGEEAGGELRPPVNQGAGLQRNRSLSALWEPASCFSPAIDTVLLPRFKPIQKMSETSADLIPPLGMQNGSTTLGNNWTT